ncbi:hypothetical protein C4J83_3315 [Pseudomonas sp. LBUM920]|nr:hypothetical protein C4J83_3315 [Pseudomonas sp. LBUM920]
MFQGHRVGSFLGLLRNPTRGKPARHWQPAYHCQPARHCKPAHHR